MSLGSFTELQNACSMASPILTEFGGRCQKEMLGREEDPRTKNKQKKCAKQKWTQMQVLNSIFIYKISLNCHQESPQFKATINLKNNTECSANISIGHTSTFTYIHFFLSHNTHRTCFAVFITLCSELPSKVAFVHSKCMSACGLLSFFVGKINICIYVWVPVDRFHQLCVE